MSTERPDTPDASDAVDRTRPGVLIVCDVDGVVSPVHGATAWGDDVEVGELFGPVVLSPSLVAHLDALAAMPGVTCVWLSDWTPPMRQRMSLFPGRDWPHLPREDTPAGSRGWWKLDLLEAALSKPDTPGLPQAPFGTVVWLDDELNSGPRQAACRRRLEPHCAELLLLPPRANEGLTPAQVAQVGQRVKTRVEARSRRRLDVAWRTSPVAPCGCAWDGVHCPHCGSVTNESGDAWEPAHTLSCHRRSRRPRTRTR